MQHYFTKKPTSKLKTDKIKAEFFNKEFEFVTSSGVFSKKKVDLGTELLIKKSITKPGWMILDLGCGYGVVGIVLAKLNPKAKVVMSDVNSRAVMLAKKNSVLNKVKNVRAVHSDSFEKIKGGFDTVLLNPPQTAGKKVCFQLIDDSKTNLKKGGLLQIVARHNKGGKDLSKHMKELFGNVEEVAKQSGYRIYASEK